MQRFLVLAFLIGCGATMLTSGGCGRAASEEELGTVVFEVPEVPGAEAPFSMPELGPEDDTTSTPGTPDLPLPGAEK